MEGKDYYTTNRLTALLLKLDYYTSDLKYQQGKKMF